MTDDSISECCGVEAFPVSNSKLWRCSKCLKVCEIETVCEFCNGTGEIPADQTDSNGNIMAGVELQECICQIEL